MSKTTESPKPTCCAAIRNKSGSRFHFTYHACGKSAKFERDGKHYCGTHDPVTIAQKDEAKQLEWKREHEARARQRTRDLIVEKYHDQLVCVLEKMMAFKEAFPNALELEAWTILAEIKEESK